MTCIACSLSKVRSWPIFFIFSSWQGWFDVTDEIFIFSSFCTFPFRVLNDTFLFIFFLFLSLKHTRATNFNCIVRVTVFNITFNNISAISWRSVLLVEETGVHRENHGRATNHRQTLSHNVVLNTPRHERDWNSQF